MPKPAPRTKLPNGGEAVLEHFHEGPETWERFTKAVRQIVGVSKGELARREAEWQQGRAKAKRKGR